MPASQTLNPILLARQYSHALAYIKKVTENLEGIEIEKVFQKIELWEGTPIKNSYGSKPVLDYKGEPLFAELYLLRQFYEQGFKGVWVDTYRRRFRTQLPENQKSDPTIPDFVFNILWKINPDKKLKGSWDLLLWKNSEIKFVELKRKGKDKIRQTQIDFLKRAIRQGFNQSDFKIIEWTEKNKNVG